MASTEMESIRKAVSDMTEKDKRHRNGLSEQISFHEEMRRRLCVRLDSFRAENELVRAQRVTEAVAQINEQFIRAADQFEESIVETDRNLMEAVRLLKVQLNEFSE